MDTQDIAHFGDLEFWTVKHAILLFFTDFIIAFVQILVIMVS